MTDVDHTWYAWTRGDPVERIDVCVDPNPDVAAAVFYPGTFLGGNPPNFEFPPKNLGEVCYYVNVIPVSLLSAQN